MDLSELWEARRGRPTEREAVRKIATFAVIPAAMVGLLVSTRFVALADPVGRLLWVCSAAAFGAGFGIAFLMLGIYHLFGFRPVALLADAIGGGLIGLLCGSAVAQTLMAFNLVPAGHALWPLLLIPISALAAPLLRVWRETTHERKALAQTSPRATEEVVGATTNRRDA